MNEKRIRLNLEKRALNISMRGGIIFLIIEFIIAVGTNSQAVLMDSAYDAAELIMIVISIRIIPLLYRPVTEKHPFGYSQVESLFIVIRGFMLTAVTIGLVVNNIQIMLQGGRNVSFVFIAYFEFFATILSVLTILTLNKFNKKLNSPMVQTEMNGWFIDSIASFGMAIAFFIPVVFQTPWMSQIMPYLDQIIAIILSVFILPVPIKTIITGLRDLFLLAPDEETMDYIKASVELILEDYDFKEVTYDVLKTGRKIWVSIYVTSKVDILSISTLSSIQMRIENSLSKKFPDLYVELLPDIA